jgi:hypothetical protein
LCAIVWRNDKNISLSIIAIYIIKELVPGKSKSKKRKTHNSNILGGNFLEAIFLTESHLHELFLTEKREREKVR